MTSGRHVSGALRIPPVLFLFFSGGFAGLGKSTPFTALKLRPEFAQYIKERQQSSFSQVIVIVYKFWRY